MGWNTFGGQYNVMESTLPLSLKRKVCNQCILPVLKLFESKRPGMKTSKCPKVNGENKGGGTLGIFYLARENRSKTQMRNINK